MIVVSDTSPILNLARIRRLDLLRALHIQVLIPPAVHRELTNSQSELTPIIDAALSSWLTREIPVDQNLVVQLRHGLDAGEAEAIALALERKASLLLVDERLGRSAARKLGLEITGLLGVLAEAKKKGLIEKVKPILDSLISEARFWVSSDLYNEVLVTLGEQ